VIFVTVGTDLPFDRMVRVVDDWAGATKREDVFAQVGDTAWSPKNIRHTRFLEPKEYSAVLVKASAVISHAGMGTIISALRYQKPLLVMPRHAWLGEQGNEHQLATVRRLLQRGLLTVALDEASLRRQLDHLADLRAGEAIGAFASAELVAGIRSFIFDGVPRRTK
jgi:UDP-N-acetylglucosamine transferase subunit ALG13